MGVYKSIQYFELDNKNALLKLTECSFNKFQKF